MAEIKTLEGWREDRTLKDAASLYERRASESLQRLKMASNGLEGLKASRIWQDRRTIKRLTCIIGALVLALIAAIIIR